MVTLNPFYRLPNLNKILVFGAHPAQRLQLPRALEGFCLEHSVRVKLLETPSAEALLEYVYGRSRGKILVHETINFDKALYDRPTAPHQQRTLAGKVLNPLNTRLMPQEVLLMAQRLPEESLATSRTREEVLGRMRGLLELQEGEELVDPLNRISLATIEVLALSCRRTTETKSRRWPASPKRASFFAGT